LAGLGRYEGVKGLSRHILALTGLRYSTFPLTPSPLVLLPRRQTFPPASQTGRVKRREARRFESALALCARFSEPHSGVERTEWADCAEGRNLAKSPPA